MSDTACAERPPLATGAATGFGVLAVDEAPHTMPAGRIAAPAQLELRKAMQFEPEMENHDPL